MCSKGCLRFLSFCLDLELFAKMKRPAQQTFVGLQDVLRTSSTRLQRNNFTSSKTFWRRLGRRKIVTLKTSSRRLEDMSWRRLEDMSWRRLQHVFSVTILRLPRRLEDVFKTSRKASWRRLECMSWRRLEDAFARRPKDVLKMSSRQYIGLEQDVLKTSSSRWMFAGWFLHTHRNQVYQ